MNSHGRILREHYVSLIENVALMKKILVLGGGADQIDLILDLKERGYYTVLVDYYPNPVAKTYADKHVQVSTLDLEAVLQVAKEENVENVITACTDQALVTVAYVANILGFHTQFSYEKALDVTNKLRMKEIMIANNIPTAKFVNIETLDEGVADLKYPLMIKPADSGSSKGVRKANNPHELKTLFDYAQEQSRTSRVIVEEFKPGIEVGIDCYILNGKAQLLMMGQVNKKKVNENTLLIFQTFIPAQISDKAKENIQTIANNIARVFELENTPLLIQTLVDGEEVNVIEFAARIGGASKHRTIQIKTGFNILHANVDAVLGEIPEVKTIPNDYFYSRNHIYPYPCTFDHFEGVEDLLTEGLIEELIPYKTLGMKSANTWSSSDRVGSFLVKARTMDELKEKIAEVIKRLRVIDSEGNEVLNREIYN